MDETSFFLGVYFFIRRYVIPSYGFQIDRKKKKNELENLNDNELFGRVLEVDLTNFPRTSALIRGRLKRLYTFKYTL